jgi:hypothetical protein
MTAVLDDTTCWPLIRVSLGPDVTAARFDVFAAWYEGCVKRALRDGVFLYSVTDARGPPPPLALMRHISSWQTGLSVEQLERCLINAVVIDNVLVKSTLTAINWFRRPTTQQVIVDSEATGFDVVARDFARRGLVPPVRPPWAEHGAALAAR